ncbi:MAG: hypothetical protein WC859_05225 [Elusimicrobiota bacterium]|jgi:hypothetical protein
MKKIPLLAQKAEKALKTAVAKVLKEHKRNGVPIAVWRNGKVVTIPASRIRAR